MTRSPFSNKWRRYLAVLLMPIAALLCAFVFNLSTLEAVGEYSTIERIVREQRETGGLYNGFVHSVGSYKKSGYRQAKPEITVIGSSRSLQVRDYFFNATFFNAGGEVRSPTEAFLLTDKLLRLHKPRHVVWFMDFFQFCSSSNNFRENLSRPQAVIREAETRVQRGLVPFRLIATKKVVSLSEFVTWGTGGAESHRQGVRLLGLGVQKGLSAAFGPDGSLYKFLDGAPPPNRNTLDIGLTEIERGHAAFKHDCHLNLEAMERAGINLTLIAAPMPEYILQAMRASGRYRYVNEWRERMKKRYRIFFDYTSVAPISGQDCEFLDYYHGGEVTYMRILADIGARTNSALRDVIDTARLNSLILSRAGDLVVADNEIGMKLLGAGSPQQTCPYIPKKP